MGQKFHFKKLTKISGIFLILGVAISIVAIDVVSSYRDFNFHSEKLRSDFINNQKKIIKQEVLRVAEVISHEKAQSEKLIKNTLKLRVYEAWNIAQHIYQQNRTATDNSAIVAMIKDALRPIRFEKGKGYYFMTSLDGTELLFADKPEIEGKNLLNLQDTQGKFVIRDMIEIARQSGEGFYHYHWTKPGATGDNFEKFSFVKFIEPLNCFVGAGLYIDDIEASIKQRLLSNISRIRFGKEGYIFVNSLDGDALVSNGKLVSEKKKLWEIFNTNPEKVKELFDKEYKAASTSDGDYIYYSLSKLNSPGTLSPKTSFILGIQDFQWLVGAGVYLDDVETEIATMQEHLTQQIQTKLISFSLSTLFIIIFFLLLLRKFNQNMNRDIDVITSFFNDVLVSDKPIDRQKLKFHEFDKMAKEINTMFTEKIFAQQNLYAEQNALLESEEKFQITMDSMLVGVYIIQDFVFQYVNPAMTVMFGYSREEMLNNMSPMDLVVPEQREQVRENLILRESGKLKRINDIKCIRSNGEIFDTMALGAATVHEGRAASVGTMIDITERKAAENELKRSETRATALLEASPDMVFRMNGEGIYLDIKADSNDLYVPAKEKIIGKSSKDLLPPDLANKVEKQINATLLTGSMQTIEYQLAMQDQGVQDYESRMVKSGDNEVTGIVRNITEHKKAADEKSTLERQLNQAKRMESIGLMAGGVAHDLNNILSGIVGYPDIILRKLSKNSDLKVPVEAIRDSGIRAAAVVDDLLTVARGVASTRENHSLDSMINQYLTSPECDKLQSLHTKVLITSDLDHCNSVISCSEVHIKKCIMNLVTNAVEAINGVGLVTISTRDQCVHEGSDLEKELNAGNYVHLTIADNGPGISSQDIEHIFEPFYSKKSLARSGTGLGLTVVWNTVQDHNGRIFVESTTKGTRFELYFPLQKSTESDAGKEDVETPEIATNGHGEHILVVDDESLLRNVASEMLKFLGYRVDSVASGEEAIEFVQSRKVDLLLIDMLMEPGINGYETYKEISALHPKQKAIIASGYSENKDIRATLDLGAQNFIKKPYTLEQLAAVVKDCLQK